MEGNILKVFFTILVFFYFSARTIVSLSLKENIEKPAPYDKPYDYINKPYGRYQTMKDKTTLRFDENTKLVVVEGAHAIGKTKLAKELAEEFGMLYMAPPDLNDIYIHPRYNIDFRQWQELYPNFFKSSFRRVSNIKQGMKKSRIDFEGEKFLCSIT